MSDFQTIVLRPGSGEVAVSFQGQLVDAVIPEWGFHIPDTFKTITAPAGHTRTNTVPVKFLEVGELLPTDFMSRVPQGPREFFSTQASLRYKSSQNIDQKLESHFQGTMVEAP